MLPHPRRSKYAEIQPLKAGGGDGCAGGATGIGTAGVDNTVVKVDGEARVVVVMVEVEVLSSVEMVVVVTTVGGP